MWWLYTGFTSQEYVTHLSFSTYNFRPHEVHEKAQQLDQNPTLNPKPLDP